MFSSSIPRLWPPTASRVASAVAAIPIWFSSSAIPSQKMMRKSSEIEWKELRESSFTHFQKHYMFCYDGVDLQLVLMDLRQHSLTDERNAVTLLGRREICSGVYFIVGVSWSLSRYRNIAGEAALTVDRIFRLRRIKRVLISRQRDHRKKHLLLVVSLNSLVLMRRIHEIFSAKLSETHPSEKINYKENGMKTRALRNDDNNDLFWTNCWGKRLRCLASTAIKNDDIYGGVVFNFFWMGRIWRSMQ